MNIRMLLPLATGLLLTSGAAMATSLGPPLSLDELCSRGDKVFRGTILSESSGTLQAGGGEIPILTYRVKVDEAFKGEFEEIKGSRFLEIRMLRSERVWASGLGNHMRMTGLPRLEVGASYVLMMTRPSAIGMSSPIGLAHGLFRISGRGSNARVEATAGARSMPSLTYGDFARRIREAVERGRRAR